ncbi:hypothetical protein Ahy_B10g105996 [Arachis hypogaea]|uniref:CCHC-type domain-containing protein n=1 Tax=Arachis hypogaea TaxID=3818 RepID=A0A444X9S9_ARAHY|nr:hypothetical protein Ahy_B10g105996 [Arachis hypogaea]
MAWQVATRTKQIAFDEIQETFREQYKRTYDYGHELLRANPGSSVRIQKTAHCDVMTLPYRRFSHRPVKKRRLAAGEEEQSSHTQLLRRGEKQRCSICGSVGHNKSRCPKPIKDEAQHSKKLSKGKKKKSNTNSHPPAAKGGRKTTSSQPTPKLGVKRKTTSTTQPPSSAQSNPTT